MAITFNPTLRGDPCHPRPCGQTCDPSVGTPEGIARDTCDTAIVPLLDRESPVSLVNNVTGTTTVERPRAGFHPKRRAPQWPSLVRSPYWLTAERPHGWSEQASHQEVAAVHLQPSRWQPKRLPVQVFHQIQREPLDVTKDEGLTVTCG